MDPELGRSLTLRASARLARLVGRVDLEALPRRLAGTGTGGTILIVSELGSATSMHAMRRITVTPRSTGAVSAAGA
jgi:hypothetical protein